MIVRVGVPAGGRLLSTAIEHGAPVLVSAGALWDNRRKRFRAPGVGVWTGDTALDSAGFVAMTHHGGYPWSVSEYVELVVRNRGLNQRQDDRDADLIGADCPWTWWSAMDFCCEPEVASDAAVVRKRVDATVASYGDCLEAAECWRSEGVTDLPDPMPVLQGWRPQDYVRCAEAIAELIDREHPCRCPSGDEDCDAEWHRGSDAGLPDLVGVGSVCRRRVGGPDGVLALVDALDRVLPERVKLHLFGVKSAAVVALADHPRILSVDSMAWDYAARREKPAGASNTVARRAEYLTRWYDVQRAAAAPSPQQRLFGVQTFTGGVAGGTPCA